MEIAIRSGAKVINLSLGDPRLPYRGPRPTRLGAIIDQFIRLHKIVLPSVPETICHGMAELGPDDGDYPKTLLRRRIAGCSTQLPPRSP